MIDANSRQSLIKAFEKLANRLDGRVKQERLANGLELQIARLPKVWAASLYWSGISSENEVEFCVPPYRVAPEQSEQFSGWWNAQYQDLNGRPAAARKSDPPKALRSGFTVSNALVLLERWAEQFDGTKHGPFNRWEVAFPTVSQIAAREPHAQSISEMLANARAAVAQSGAQVVRVMKQKEWRFPDDLAFRNHVRDLLRTQHGLCGLTTLPLQFRGSCSDEDMLASLDRINSDGHYEAGNLQIVCRFANRWKNDDDANNFRRLLVSVVRNMNSKVL